MKGFKRISINNPEEAGISRGVIILILTMLFLLVSVPAIGQDGSGEESEIPLFGEKERRFDPVQLYGGLTNALIEIDITRWGDPPLRSQGQQQVFNLSIASQPPFISGVSWPDGSRVVFEPGENKKSIQLQFNTNDTGAATESGQEIPLIILIKAGDPQSIPVERKLFIPMGFHPAEAANVHACVVKKDAEDFKVEEAARYCSEAKLINEYDQIVVFFTPKRSLSPSHPEAFRFRITNPNGKVISRGTFIKSGAGEEETEHNLEFTESGSPGRFAVKLDLWNQTWLPEEPEKQWYIPGTYEVETIGLKASEGVGLFGQGQGRKAFGEWQKEGEFIVSDGLIRFAGFIIEPARNKSMSRTPWRWSGTVETKSPDVKLESGSVTLEIDGKWRDAKRDTDGNAIGPGEKLYEGKTTLALQFPKTIRPGKVIKATESRGSFLYPLEPVAEVTIQWKTQGDKGACFKPTFYEPTPHKGTPSRKFFQKGWKGRSSMDVPLGDTKALFNNAWYPSQDSESVFKVGICDSDPFGEPADTLPWHLRDKETLWLFPIQLIMDSNVELYAYGIYKYTPGPYEGPQPDEPVWGDGTDESDSNDTTGTEDDSNSDDDSDPGDGTGDDSITVPGSDTSIGAGDGSGGTGPGTAGGITDPAAIDPDKHQDAAALIREWLSIASPPENAVEGVHFRYDSLGRKIGGGITTGRVISSHNNVDYGTGISSEAKVWSALRADLDSIDHCILETYVMAKLNNGSISHCAGRYGAVKDLKGMKLGKAKAAVTAAGFKYDDPVPGTPAKTAEAGDTIERQEPGPDQYLKKGQVLKLVVHTPYVPGKVTLPDFIGEPLGEAKEWLKKNKLKMQQPKAGSHAPTREKSGTIEAQEPVAGTVMKAGGKVTFTVHSNYVDARSVPNVVKSSAGKAKILLEKAGLKADPKPGGKPSFSEQAGTVARQSPVAGTSVPPGTEVEIFVYSPYVKTTAVPELVGERLSDAINALQNAGLGINPSMLGPAPDEGKAGRIKSQNPLPGSIVPPGTRVQVDLWGDYEDPGIRTPDVRDQKLADAINALQNAGLGINPSMLGPASDERKAGRIKSQNPLPGSIVAPGTRIKVDLWGDYEDPGTGISSIIPTENNQQMSTGAWQLVKKSGPIKSGTHGGENYGVGEKKRVDFMGDKIFYEASSYGWGEWHKAAVSMTMTVPPAQIPPGVTSNFISVQGNFEPAQPGGAAGVCIGISTVKLPGNALKCYTNGQMSPCENFASSYVNIGKRNTRDGHTTITLGDNTPDEFKVNVWITDNGNTLVLVNEYTYRRSKNVGENVLTDQQRYPARIVKVHDLTGSYDKGLLKVTLEDGKYVGKSNRSYPNNSSLIGEGYYTGITLFEVSPQPDIEETLHDSNVQSITAYPGKCLNVVNGRVTYLDCHVHVGYALAEYIFGRMELFVKLKGNVRVKYSPGNYTHDSRLASDAVSGQIQVPQAPIR